MLCSWSNKRHKKGTSNILNCRRYCYIYIIPYLFSAVVFGNIYQKELGGRYLCKVIDKGRSAGCSAWPANLVATSHCQGWVYKYQAGGRQRPWDRWKLRRLCFKVIHTLPDPYQVVVAGSLFWTVLTYRGCKPPLLGKSRFRHPILKCCFGASWDFF